MFLNKLDSIQADMYLLRVLETKLLWINGSQEEAAQILTDATALVLQTKQGS